MPKFQIKISYEEDLDGEKITWAIEDDGFPPTATTIIGTLHRVATLVTLERTGIVDFEAEEGEEE